MKKNICIGVLGVLLCTSLVYSFICNHNSNVTIDKLKQTINQTKDTGSFVTEKIEDEGTDFDLNKIDGFDQWKVDKEMALQIGNAVLKNLVCGEKTFKETSYEVYDVKDKGFYIIHRVPKDPNMAGGDYGVAINKKDGKIIKIWIGA